MLGIQPTYVLFKGFFSVFRLLRACMFKLSLVIQFKSCLHVSDTFARHSYAILTCLGWKNRFFLEKILQNCQKCAKKWQFFGTFLDFRANLNFHASHDDDSMCVGNLRPKRIQWRVNQLFWTDIASPGGTWRFKIYQNRRNFYLFGGSHLRHFDPGGKNVPLTYR